MINVAIFKYITGAKKSSVAAARGGGKKKSKLNTCEALQRLFDDHLKPYIEANLAGTSIKSAIASDEILLIFKEVSARSERALMKDKHTRDESREMATDGYIHY